MARPTKLTAEIQLRICEAVRAGNYLDVAAQYAGIGSATFHRWLARGAKERAGAYAAFHAAVTKAERDAEVALVATWRRQTIEAIVQEELGAALEKLRGVLDLEAFRRVVDTLSDERGGERDPGGLGG